jgi:rfaE bifunctional protein nucleotidyltransferase chain/domain
MTNSKKLLSELQAEQISSGAKSSGKIVGMCHGVFDLLHPGHFAHFKAAKAKVDLLIVSVTADRFVNKGPGRPLFPEEVRAQTISMLECVDYVLVSEYQSAIHSIDLIKPSIYFKGSDYVNHASDITGMISKESAQVKKHGGDIQYTNELTSSSTSLINAHFSNRGKDLEEWIRDFRSKYSTELVYHYLDSIENTKIGIIGEIIIDKYTNCEPLAKSSKDPILAFQIQDTQTFMGGILAIADNIKSWAKQVYLISCLPNQVPQEQSSLVDEIIGIDNMHIVESENKLIVKHRYVDTGSGTRVFETYDFNQESMNVSGRNLFQLLESCDSKVDIWIVADYGHGLISREVASKISTLEKFLAVNTQANAGNRGYNTITKYPHADFLSLNGSELQLELRDRNPAYEVIVPQYMERLKSSYAVVTLGAKGMMIFSKKDHTLVPALGSRVVDKVGAGDSVLAIGSILARHGAPIEIIGLVASIVAAHEISQLGHQSSLKILDIKKAVKGLLG